jgi:predicted dehydrogenase
VSTVGAEARDAASVPLRQATPQASVGVAVIGCGSTAERRHLPVWPRLPGAHLETVVSRDPARAKAAQQRYGARRAVTDWQEVLHDPAVAIADICVPHPLHAEIAIAMAAAGKHVLCEKPLAPDLASAEAMVAAAQRSGTILLPFHNMRFLGAAAAARALVQEGRIGRPLILRGVMSHGGPDASDPRRRWFLDASAGGGAILDLGPHLFDMVRALHPLPATRLRATVIRPEGMAVDRDGVVEIAFSDGALAVLVLSWSQGAGRETSLVVHGAAGTLRMTLLHAPDPSPGNAVAPLAVGEGWGPRASIAYPEVAGDDTPCAAMLRALHGEDPGVTALDGLEAVRWIDACYRSHAADGSWIDLQRGG